MKKVRIKARKRPTLDDFSALDEPHPYGVLPGGNRFVSPSFESPSSQKNNRRRKRRSEQEIFSDGIWQTVLGFCDARSLGSIVQTSRYLYVAGHQPELWRDLVLRRCQSSKKMIDKAGSSWKDTYVQLFASSSSHCRCLPHQPMAVSGVYSDDYYRTHVCRSFALPEAWFVEEDDDENDETNPTRVPAVTNITPEAFLQRYENSNKPVILRGAASAAPALQQWQDPKYLSKHNTKGKSFRATSGAAPLPADFTLEAYEEYTRFAYLEESPLYLFDRTAFQSNPQWSDDFFPTFYANNPHWDPSPSPENNDYNHDLLQHLGEGKRPDHTWLIMGPKRSGSVFHIDPNATHAWNVCIQGRKRWIFYPPGQNPPGVFPSEDGDEVALPLSVGEWLMQYWKDHSRQIRRHQHRSLRKTEKGAMEGSSSSLGPMECTVGPGDVIFVPHGWWHMVINLDDRNMAVTHNYVSPSNLGNVLKFFREKQDQISGCRDRTESIKPERLREEFLKALESREGSKDYLQKALEQTKWTCRAWKNDESAVSQQQQVPELLAASPTTSKKRPHTAENEDERNSTEKRQSVMAQTEKVAAFTFSFL